MQIPCISFESVKTFSDVVNFFLLNMQTTELTEDCINLGCVSTVSKNS